MDDIDPLYWIIRTCNYAGKYIYRNVTLPRISPEYEVYRPIITIPSRQDIIVWIWEILASVHPNYYVISLLFVCVSIFVYIKVRYPFWNTQPVVHIYDYFRRWASSPEIIQKYLFKTRFYDKTKQIQTTDYTRIPKDTVKQLCEFIQSNYIPTDRLLCTINEKIITTYMSGHNSPSFVSIHRELDGKITGVCTSRLWKAYFYSERMICIDTYLVDFVCVRRNYDNSQLSERLFQTHEYNIRILNPTISVSIFQKEGELCECVVPLYEYKTYTFYMRNLQMDPLSPHFTISRVGTENIDLLHDIYHILTTSANGTVNMFSVCLLSDIGHIQLLLKSCQLYLFCLKKGGHLYGVYFMKDANIHYEDLDGKTLSVVSSIQNTDSSELFMTGFMHSLRLILRETRQYKMLTISDIGHNSILLNKWQSFHHTILETPGALYLYNYIYPNMPLKTHNIFIL
jgi:hypothetical protein